jgi:hypothetical protein
MTTDRHARIVHHVIYSMQTNGSLRINSLAAVQLAMAVAAANASSSSLGAISSTGRHGGHYNCTAYKT